MVCTGCGKKISAGWSFCAHCGAPLPEPEPTERKRRTRGNGEGSVYKRGKTWTAQRVVGHKSCGEGRTSLVYARKGGFATKKEALAALPTLTQSATAKKGGETLLEVYEKWRTEYARRGRSAKTAAGYESAFAYYKELWTLKFKVIGIDDLQECVDNCPHGKRTRELMRGVMSQLYKYAIPRRISYDEANLATFLFCAGDPAAPKARFSDEELETLREAIGRVPFAEYVYADCYLGYRPSEFVALDCANYDYAERYFKAGAKTEAGKNRAVTISPKIQGIVDARLAGRTEGPVFADADGRRMTYDRWRQVFNGVLAALEMPTYQAPAADGRKLTPHCCRHTARSLMDHAAGSEMAKMEIIGHASEEMSKRYTHQQIRDLREVTDSM